ncbi:MAG: diaminopimelate epimerase [Actinobacteria bacterium]|nr:diaminopimelate epimerase [Actinomycetota bacterium]
MKKIDFVKMNGQGNDFIIIDAVNNDAVLLGDVIAKMCDRHFGIGADGLILVKKSDKADFFMDYYNQDGSTAEMCGNGIRCMAGFIRKYNLLQKLEFSINTRAGIKNINLSFIPGKDLADISESLVIKVSMGSPVFEPDEIPVNINADFNKNIPIDKKGPDKVKKSIKGIIVHDYPLEVCGRIFKINCVSMGNPHCIIYLDPETDINSIPLEKWGSAIETHKIFPNKANVEFISINSGQIFMRVWERGVGETLACGTGACASAVCSMALGKINTGMVKVNLPGGALDISWDGNGSSVFLSGTVEFVFEGSYFLKD